MKETKPMIKALHILSQDIQSGDGVANTCVADAAKMIGELDSQLKSAKNLFAQFYQVLGAHDANEKALDAALAASDGNFDFELCPYMAKVDVDGLQEQLAKANERVKYLDKSVLEEIENRDNREEWLDAMAAEISRYFGVDIGEHSSANNPWDEAIQAIPTSTLNKFAIENQIKALESLRVKYESQTYPLHSMHKLLELDVEQLRKEQSNG